MSKNILLLLSTRFVRLLLCLLIFLEYLLLGNRESPLIATNMKFNERYCETGAAATWAVKFCDAVSPQMVFLLKFLIASICFFRQFLQSLKNMFVQIIML